MSIAEKLQLIAENEQEVYNAGKTKMNKSMMDAIVNKGENADFRYAFYGNLWNDSLFMPSSKISPKVFNYAFRDNKVEYGAYTDKLDFSSCISLLNAFRASTIRKLKVVDARKVQQGQSGMVNTFYECRQLESIDEFYPPAGSTKAEFSNTFLGCTSLSHIIFKSEISQGGLNLKDSTLLDKESLESIIERLSTATTGITVTLSLTAVNNAFEGGRDGAEWQALIATKSNWTMAYA